MSEDITTEEWFQELMRLVEEAKALHKKGERKKANELFYFIQTVFDKRIPNPTYCPCCHRKII